jgi:hypothetical protein
MAKRHGRPSAEYRYEHYDPRSDQQVDKPLPGAQKNPPTPVPQDADASPKDGDTK